MDADNRDLLKTPVGNKNLYTEAGDYIVMTIGRPNARKDYHFRPRPGLFCRSRGDIEGHPGERQTPLPFPSRKERCSCCRATPHQPRRGPNTVGLVIVGVSDDRDMQDGLQWYCETNHLLHGTARAA